MEGPRRNWRHRRIVLELLLDADPAKAAVRAGFKTRLASQYAWRLLRRPEVRAALLAARKEQEARTGITRERVIREYARIAHADISRIATWARGGMELLPLEDISDDDAAAIAELAEDRSGKTPRIRVRLHRKAWALKALSRMLGLGPARPAAPADDDAAGERLIERLEDLAGRTGKGG